MAMPVMEEGKQANVRSAVVVSGQGVGRSWEPLECPPRFSTFLVPKSSILKGTFLIKSSPASGTVSFY